MTPDNRKKIAEALNQVELPPLGDPAKKYFIELTKPEINCIHAMFGFMSANLAQAEAQLGIRPKISDSSTTQSSASTRLRRVSLTLGMPRQSPR